MKVLFDQNVPRNLRPLLIGHETWTAAELGWARIDNGDLLRAAEDEGFDIFLTGDQNLSYQQNLNGRTIGIVEITKNNWPSVELGSRRLSTLSRHVVPAATSGLFVSTCIVHASGDERVPVISNTIEELVSSRCLHVCSYIRAVVF